MTLETYLLFDDDLDYRRGKPNQYINLWKIRSLITTLMTIATMMTIKTTTNDDNIHIKKIDDNDGLGDNHDSGDDDDNDENRRQRRRHCAAENNDNDNNKDYRRQVLVS